MSVRSIEKISIPGFEKYILYSFDYSPGFADGAGYINAEFVNSSGEYDLSALNLALASNSFFSITLRSKSFGRFIVASYELVEDERVKILKVKFVDKSIELDRHYIAVRGQIGYDTQSYNQLGVGERARIVGHVPNTGRVIWVGTSDEACKGDALDNIMQDPCDPCNKKFGEEIINFIDCNEYYILNKRIYQYTFSELISQIQNRVGITFNAPVTSYDQKFDYSGTVREVLNSVCAELGITFYYLPSGNSRGIIKFVSISAGIEINRKNILSLSNKCKVQKKTVSRSREGSMDTIGFASYQKDMEEKQYGCAMDSCRKLTMVPFTLIDVLDDAAHIDEDEVITTSGIDNFEKLEFYSVISGKVGRDFRDLFVWTQEYKFKTAADVESKIDKKLSALNGMTIRRVFHPKSSDFQDRATYRVLTKLNTSKDFDAIESRALKKKQYFFLAEIDEKKNEQIATVEDIICESFLGQFWLRRFKQHWTGLSYSAISPDGSIDYFDYKSPISFPFIDLVLAANGKFERSPLSENPVKVVGTGVSSSIRANDTFYLMNRPPQYDIVGLEKDSVKESIRKNIDQFLYKELSIPVELSNKFKKLFKDDPELKNYDPSTHKVFVVTEEFGNKSINISFLDIDHPKEVENVEINVNACNKSTTYGLNSANAKKFNITFNDFSFSITLPAQAHTIDNGGNAHDGYTILVERSGNDTSVFVPKTEVFSSSSGTVSSNSPRLGINLNTYNASLADLALVAGSFYNNATSYFCNMNLGQIQNLLSPISATMSHISGNSNQESYSVEGLPIDNYGVEDGLKSLSISIGSNGLKTELSFSNSLAEHLSPEQFFQKLKQARLNQLQRPLPNGRKDPNAPIPTV